MPTTVTSWTPPPLDKFDNDYFQLIGQKGLFEYYAYVVPSQSELAITQQQLREEMFSFLD